MSSGAWKVAVGLAAVAGTGMVTYYLYKTGRGRGCCTKPGIPERISELLKADYILLGGDAQEKVERMCANIPGGKKRLQVVTDFDMTLTRYKDENGERYATCHGVLETSDKVPAWYREKTKMLKDHYFPLEYSATLSHEEKANLMDEWWDKAHENLIRVKLNSKLVPEMVRESHIKFRDGAGELLSYLQRRGIPLCIVSAGLADILSEAITQMFGTMDNISVVSNQMQFDSGTGELNGFSGPVIHSYNKAIAVRAHCRFDAGERNNIVLLGDSLGDPQMVPEAGELPPNFTVLRIGYLNDASNEKLKEKYHKAYDIVILGDRDMSFINGLLQTLAI